MYLFQCCLIAFLQLTETKLKAWTAKYGRAEKVIQLLDQYRNFVSKNHIFQEFNKAFIDMQAVIEEYRRDGNIGKYKMRVLIKNVKTSLSLQFESLTSYLFIKWVQLVRYLKHFPFRQERIS